MIKNGFLTSQEKQNIWRQKQIEIMYGSGRPIFTMTPHTQFFRHSYDVFYYMYDNKWKYLDNKNYIEPNKGSRMSCKSTNK